MKTSLRRSRTRAARASRAVMVAGALVIGLGVSVPAVALAASAHSQAAASPKASGATLKLKATTALPGQGVKFTGDGFKVSERVTLHWGTAGGTPLVKVTASKTGTISGAFTVPLPKGGPAIVDIVAVGSSSKKQAEHAFAQACTDEWTNTKGGNWSKAASWSAGRVPGPTTAACITLPAAKKYTVILNGSTTVGSLQVGAPTGKLTQALAVDATKLAVHLKLEHPSTVWPHGVLELTSAVRAGDYVEGPGLLKNFGLLETLPGKGGSRYFDNSVVNEKGGTFAIRSGSGSSSTHQQGGSFTNSGTTNVATGSSYQVGGGTVSQPGGSVNNGGTILVSDAVVSKTGGAASGNAWQLTDGTSLADKAGTGAYTYYGSGMLSGVIPAGQTVTVAGHGSAGIQLGLQGTVTNNGTLQLTSAKYNGDPSGNAWLIGAAGTAVPKLYNNGQLVTRTGAGGTKLLDVNVLNRSKGVVSINADKNWVQGGWSITNAGTLNMGDAAVLDLIGNTSGNANLIERDVATMGITVNGTTGKTSVIHQEACPAAATACQSEAIDLGGKLTVAAIGPIASGSYVPIYSEQSAVAGAFSTIPDGYGQAYNEGPTAALPNLVGDMVLNK